MQIEKLNETKTRLKINPRLRKSKKSNQNMNVLLTFCYNFFFKSKSSSTHFFDNLCQLWSDLMWFDLLNSILISFFVFFKIDYTYLNFLNFHKITTLLLILRLREPKLAIKKEEDFFLLGMAEVNWSVSCISLWLSSWRPILGVVIWQKICWFLKRKLLLLPFPFESLRAICFLVKF